MTDSHAVLARDIGSSQFAVIAQNARSVTLYVTAGLDEIQLVELTA